MGRIRNQQLLDQIGRRLKQIGEERGITLETFYNDTSIHLACIETGELNVTISTCEAICDYFNTSLSDFFAPGRQQIQPRK